MATTDKPQVLDDEVEAQEVPEAQQAEPTVSAPLTEKEPTTRASRRALFRQLEQLARQQAAADEKEAQVRAAKREAELAEIAKSEAFQRFQREQEEKLRAERERAAKLETQMQERAFEERAARLQVLEAEMDDEDLDPERRRAARQEYMTLAVQDYQDRLAKWEQFKRSEIIQAGLDPADPRFNRQYSPGHAGLAEFQADLRAAENEKLKRELAEAKKSTVDPATLAALVKKELAKMLAQAGLDAVDLGEPDATSLGDDAWERDLKAFQSGAMSPADYTRKWGKR